MHAAARVMQPHRRIDNKQTHGGSMIMKKLIISMACCAFIAPLAFADDSRTATATEQGLTVTGTSTTTTVEGGEVASYQPAKTLVVHNEGSGRYVLNGRGHVFDSKGERIQSAIKPGAHVHVYFANNGGVRTIDHVVVD
jgi:hypothetical protein